MSEIGDGPVDVAYLTKMQALGEVVDEIFNPDKKKKEVGFVLMIFPFGDKGRMNYLSNADRKDVLAALKEQVAKFEGRSVDGPKNPRQ